MFTQLIELALVLVAAAFGFYFLAHHKAQVQQATDNAARHIDSLEDKLASAEARIELQVVSEISHLRALAGNHTPVAAASALPIAPAVTPIVPAPAAPVSSNTPSA